jgi:hypothetical protein
MRTPLVIFSPNLRLFRSPAEAERALTPEGIRPLDGFDAGGRPLRLVQRSGWRRLFQGAGVALEAGASTASGRREFRLRLAEEVVRLGAPRPWAEGAPLGALVAEAARRAR